MDYDSPSFQGKYANFPEINFSPKPLQKPHPPIWIGGESPKALKRAAKLGDGWYPIGRNPVFPLKTIDQMKSSIEILSALTLSTDLFFTIIIPFKVA